jgi:hypothetical protein
LLQQIVNGEIANVYGSSKMLKDGMNFMLEPSLLKNQHRMCVEGLHLVSLPRLLFSAVTPGQLGY